MIKLFALFLAGAVLSLFAYSQVDGQMLVFKDGFEPAPPPMIHRWTFSENGGSGTVLVDDIGGANGILVESGANNAQVRSGQVKIIGGAGDDSDFVALPPVISGLDDATIEIWATQESVRYWGRIFDVGTTAENSLMMSWDFAGNDNSDRMQWLGSDDQFIDNAMSPYVLGREFHIVMTIDRNDEGAESSTVRLYLDGEFRGELEINNVLSDLGSGDFHLARSRQSDDETAHASYNEIRIYDGVLNHGQILDSFNMGPVSDKVEKAIYLGSIPTQPVGYQFQISHSVTSTAGPVSQAVTWTSSNPAVASVSPSGLLSAKSEGVAVITIQSEADLFLTTSSPVTINRAWAYNVYPFNETGDSGTILRDIVGQADGQLIRVGDHDSSVGGGRVSLVGGSKDTADFIKLGPILTYLKSAFTIELWAATSSEKAWSRIFDFGPNTDNNLFMSWTQFASPGTDRVEMRRHGQTAFSANDTMAGGYIPGLEYHIVMTVHEGGGTGGKTLIKWYRNGQFVSSAETTAIWSDQIDFDGNWLGRSKYEDETANASYNEIRIYDGILTDAEIAANFAEGPLGGGAWITAKVTGPGSVEAGDTVQLAATVSSTAGSISQAVNWSSSNLAVATIDAAGLVRGVGAGVTEIRATSQVAPSASGIHSVTVTVTPPPPPPPLAAQAMVYYPGSDKFYAFRYNNFLITTWNQPWPEGSYPISGGWAGWPAEWGPGDVDAAFYYPGNEKFYLFKGSEYSRHSAGGAVDPGYPRPIAGNWSQFPAEWAATGVDAAVWSPENNKVYFFKGDSYSRASWGENMDAGYPAAIADAWSGWPQSWGTGDVDAVTYYPGTRKFYFFKGYEYFQHDRSDPVQSGQLKSYDQWKFPVPPAVKDLVGDFDALKTSLYRQSWDGMIFPDGWADSRLDTAHIQGAAIVNGNQWVFSHNRKEDPGFLIHGTNNDFTFSIWPGFGKHPGSIQSSGSVVAVPFDNPKEIRFFQFGAGEPRELVHLQLDHDDNSPPNAVGMAYFPPKNAYYLIIGDITSNTVQQEYSLYKSIPGKSLTDPFNRFEFEGLIDVLGSESGMQLMYDEKTGKMHLVTLYRTEGSSIIPVSHHHAYLTELDLDNLTGTFIRQRNNFDTTANALADPSFRYGAGTFVDQGRLILFATERCIPPINFENVFCLSLDNKVDYFILSP
jgi:hypothetical protein